MYEDFAFLRVILNQPGDDVSRLVYADWLDERDDPRGSYVRLDLELHRLADDNPARRAELTEQMRALAPKLDARWAGWMSWARKPAPASRIDLALVNEGKGLIDVRGGLSDTVLLVEGKPIALNWDDCQGSVGQYLVFTHHTRGADYARQLTDLVEGALSQTQPLADQLGPLLALLAPGTYSLAYTPSAAAIDNAATLEHPGRASAREELDQYYPAYQRSLIGTQASESLNEEQVTYFQGMIRDGLRPIVLTISAEGSWCEFVIDGHHKLAAYRRVHTEPTILSIVRVQAPEISLNEGLEWLPPRHSGISKYRRMKGYPVG